MKRKSTPSTSKQVKKQARPPKLQRRRVMIFGTFDHFHPGHASLIEQAKKLGDVTIIVARDQNVEKIKGRIPDQSEEERKSILETQNADCTVLLGNTESFFAPIEEVQPDLILLGYDQKLPPGISKEQFSCKVHRAQAHHPERFKSSFSHRKRKD